MFYRSRYYFILFEVDAPVMKRFKRFNIKYKNTQVDLENFIEMDDKVRKSFSINHEFRSTLHLESFQT